MAMWRTSVRVAAAAALLLGGLAGARIASAASAEFCSGVSEIPTDECEALAALYDDTDGPNWVEATGWMITPTPASWFGVTVSSGHVVSLVLSENNLSGIIPSELAFLTELEVLCLDGNELGGPVPDLSPLQELRILDLSDNQLTGIPPDLSAFPKLEFADLSGNVFTPEPDTGAMVLLGLALLASRRRGRV